MDNKTDEIAEKAVTKASPDPRLLRAAQEKSLTNGLPVQGALFDLIPVTERNAIFSNSFDLYTALPRHVWYRSVTRDIDESVKHRPFEYMGNQYDLTLEAAKIEDDSKGVRRLVQKFPGEREELVEQALFRVASDRGIEHSEGELWRVFYSL